MGPLPLLHGCNQYYTIQGRHRVAKCNIKYQLCQAETFQIASISDMRLEIVATRKFKEFKLMLQCDKIEEIGVHALKIMELLQLGKMEKGSISSDG
eukprot:scaffold70674_cov79-Cyclotella_meneghiniana.AAC.1